MPPSSQGFGGARCWATVSALTEKPQPDWNQECPFGRARPNGFRNDYVESILEEDKGELEIRPPHEEMDLLLTRQWQRLLEIQRIQMDLMGQVVGQQEKPSSW